jgi:hypothetical protein
VVDGAGGRDAARSRRAEQSVFGGYADGVSVARQRADDKRRRWRGCPQTRATARESQGGCCGAVESTQAAKGAARRDAKINLAARGRADGKLAAITVLDDTVVVRNRR